MELTPAQLSLLKPYNHAVRSGQLRDLRTFEPHLFHPLATICAGEVESTVSFNEHIEAHEQPEDVLLAAVVDERLMDDQGSAGGEGLGVSVRTPPTP